MVNVSDSGDEAVLACRSVMMEVLTILGKHRKHLVVVGGWVPPLLFGAGDHIGSIDVDLAIDWRQIPDYVYETITKDLQKRGYYRKLDDPENRFWRDVKRGADTYRIRVDLITGADADDEYCSGRLIQGMQVWCARGVKVALDHWVGKDIDGVLPDGGKNKISARVATAGALIVMKGIALDERMKEKDAYDIYYCCCHHPDGIESLAAELNSMAVDSPIVVEAGGNHP